MHDVLFYIPYCGTPPVPEVLWSRWNLDPILIMVLFALAVASGRQLFGAGVSSFARGRRLAFIAGWFAIAIALISPLCNLTTALFSARVGQHMWLAIAAAPLVALGRPSRAALAFASGRGIVFARRLTTPLVAGTLFGVFLWFWHLPRPYEWTFESHLAYWLMHGTLTGSAVLLWEALLSKEPGHLAGRLFAGFATLLHMGLLGALITLAPRLLYPAHQQSTRSWGLSPLEDQQLGGLIMWVPGCTALAIIVLANLLELLRESDPARAPRRVGRWH